MPGQRISNLILLTFYPYSERPTMASFPLFSRLPLELRHEIWGLGSTVPREVRINPHFAHQPDCTDADLAGTCERGLDSFRSPTSPPSAMYTCRESRAFLQSTGGYTRAFMGGLRPVYTWVNFAVDSICPGEFDSFEMVVQQEAKRIIDLVIDCDHIMGEWEHWNLTQELHETSVKRLTIQERDRKNNEIEWVEWAYRRVSKMYPWTGPQPYETRIICSPHLGGNEINMNNMFEICYYARIFCEPDIEDRHEDKDSDDDDDDESEYEYSDYENFDEMESQGLGAGIQSDESIETQ
ncbi:hypothetical protein PG995_013879 [Apiospora arundinis]